MKDLFKHSIAILLFFSTLSTARKDAFVSDPVQIELNTTHFPRNSSSFPLNRSSRSPDIVSASQSELPSLGDNEYGRNRAYLSWPATNGTSIVLVTAYIENYGQSSEYVSSSRVYTSQDEGATWNQSTAVPSSARVTPRASYIPNKFYLVGKRDLYVTLDGLTFTLAITAASDIRGFSMHPVRGDVFLYWTSTTLYLVFDDGNSIRPLQLSSFYDFGWLVLPNEVKLVQIKTKSVMDKYTLLTSSVTKATLQLPVNTVLDTVSNNKLSVFGGDVFALGKDTIANQPIWLAAQNDTNVFERVQLPAFRDLIMLASNQDVLHFALGTATGQHDLYAWDRATRASPTLVLRNLNCPKSEDISDKCDLVCSSLVHGLCLANVRGKQVTLRTVNGGQSWQELEIQDRTVCGFGGKCPLHLLMTDREWTYSMQFVPTEFSDAAAYLVVGAASTVRNVKVSVVSNDGGQMWTPSSNAVVKHEILDHGGLIVAQSTPYDAHARTGTTSVKYSVDEGQTFASVKVAETAVEMINILTHPKESSASAISVGHHIYSDRSDVDWVLLGMDFSPLLSRDCTRDDFTIWNPAGTGASCSNGMQQLFQRRKPESLCRIGPNFQAAAPVIACNCTQEDLICAPQFERQGDRCVPSATACNSEPSPAYVRVSLNRCEGGLSTQLEQLVQFPACDGENDDDDDSGDDDDEDDDDDDEPVSCIRADFLCAPQFQREGDACVPTATACGSDPVPAYVQGFFGCEGGVEAELLQIRMHLPPCTNADGSGNHELLGSQDKNDDNGRSVGLVVGLTLAALVLIVMLALAIWRWKKVSAKAGGSIEVIGVEDPEPASTRPGAHAFDNPMYLQLAAEGSVC
eukprot:m.233253 g.233253  ORF g.233253 m.233253 type:complete len:857 (-) comp17377_c0_seq2:106-2676(-)